MTSDLKRGLWSDEEDHKLISYINRYGIWNWTHMPKFAGLSRSGKSCRLRWMNHLKPNLKRGEFSKEEDESILHFHSLLGNKWSAIASRLPGRTDNDVKNHWHSHLKKRVSESSQSRSRKTTKQNDDNMSPPFENIQHHESNFISFEHNGSSSCTTTTSKDPGVEFRDDSGTSSGSTFDDDLQCFWDQLCPLENVELRNIDNDFDNMDVFYDHVFQDCNNDPISSVYTLVDENNDYNCSLLYDP